MNEKKFYITTPLYYVNDVPHIGHAYSTIGADVQARYKRACGVDVAFQTGTDEHGHKILKASQEKGYDSPRQLADEVVVRFKQLWDRLDITNDSFVRTTEEYHEKAVQEFFTRIKKAGLIEKKSYDGWYCVPEETFWPETQLEQPGNLCPDCKRPTEKTSEENWFFKQPELVEKLKKHFKENPDFVCPEIRRNEVLGSYLEKENGVIDQSVTRATLKWGIKVPGDEEQVIWVWFEAVMNYVTGAGFSWDEERYKSRWPADVLVIGKDILRFHAVLFPAMLAAIDEPLPKKVFATGFIVNDGKKMSKSLGNVIDPNNWIDQYGSDVFRYYVLREVPFGQDGSVSDVGIKKRFETELANDLGNLLNRSLTMIEKYFDGKVPASSGELKENEFVKRVENLWPAYEKAMNALAYHEALDKIFEVVRDANAEIDRKAPWKLAKDESMRHELADCLYSLVETLRIVLLGLVPFMPVKSPAALQQLGIDFDALFDKESSSLKKPLNELMCWGGFEEGQAIAKGEPLFPKDVSAKKA